MATTTVKYTMGSLAGNFLLGTTQPDVTNTGLAVAGLTNSDLTVVNGNTTISTNGTVITGRLFKGLVDIPASNVTLRNCKVVSRTITSFTWDALIRSSGSNNLIENCELTQYDDTISQDNSIYYVVGVKITGGSCTVKRMNVHDVNDCIYITGGGSHQILGNYLHDLGFRTDDLDQPSNHQSHNDLIQMRMGSNNVVDGNNFEGIYSTLTGMNSTINPVPLPTEQVWPNCHCIIMEPALGVISNAVIQRNWFKYGACGIHFTSNTYSGNTATFQNNRFTPDQSKEFNEYTQIRIDPTTIWGVTDGGGNVYSNDSDTPSGDRGTPLKAPTTFSTTKVWQYNKTVHTP